MYECFKKLYNIIPFKAEQFEMIDDIATALFNQAEIRSNITEMVKMEIKWKDEE